MDKRQWNRVDTHLYNSPDYHAKHQRNYSVLNFNKINKHQEYTPTKKNNIKIDKDTSNSAKRDNKVRRDFDAKVDNITKINDKIFDLLRYVK